MCDHNEGAERAVLGAIPDMTPNLGGSLCGNALHSKSPGPGQRSGGQLAADSHGSEQMLSLNIDGDGMSLQFAAG